MTYRIKNVSQPFDAEGVKKCQYAEFVSGNITSSLNQLNGSYPDHAPWVCVAGAESIEPATGVGNIVVETVDAVWWPEPGTESVAVDAE